MNRSTTALHSLFAAAAAVAAPAANASEVFGGVYVHAVATPLSLDTGENGLDFELGIRGDPITVLRDGSGPAPYAMVSLNTAGNTDFVAAGLAWKFDLGPVYVRPGVGLSLNNGPARRLDGEGTRTDLGNRVLFEPEFGIGFNLSNRTSLEASWVHISGGQIFNHEQNPGIDMFGVRLNYRP